MRSSNYTVARMEYERKSRIVRREILVLGSFSQIWANKNQAYQLKNKHKSLEKALLSCSNESRSYLKL